MAIRSILVPVDPDRDWLAVLEAAYIVARRFDSHITVLHVTRALRPGDGNSREDIDDAEIKALIQKFAKQKRIDVSDKPTSKDGISISFKHEVGDRAEIFIHWARLFDTTAVMRPRPRGRLFRRSKSSTPLEEILVHSGRPLMVVPPDWNIHKAQHAVVAWNSSLEASRAIAMTLPWLVQMKKVTVVSAKKKLSGAEQLVQQLAWHGAKAVAMPLNRRTSSVPKRLLKICENEGADFLVMGGYSHSRMQERVFGGVTEHILKHSKIVTVMVH